MLKYFKFVPEVVADICYNFVHNFNKNISISTNFNTENRVKFKFNNAENIDITRMNNNNIKSNTDFKNNFNYSSEIVLKIYQCILSYFKYF